MQNITLGRRSLFFGAVAAAVGSGRKGREGQNAGSGCAGKGFQGKIINIGTK